MSLVVAGTRIEIKVSTVRKDMSFKRPQRYWMNIDLENIKSIWKLQKGIYNQPTRNCNRCNHLHGAFHFLSEFILLPCMY
jgi:hypothetical protein